MSASVAIYTRAWCGYCTAAVSLLRSKGVPFEQIDVANDNEKRRWLREVTGRHTVPQVFIDGTPIGGYTDLRKLDERGLLDKMLWDRRRTEAQSES
jgi:glutaredoxin 3